MNNWEVCARASPPISLIEVNGSSGFTSAYVDKGSSPKFRMGAFILLENGKITPVVRKALTDLSINGEDTETLSPTQKSDALKHQLTRFHSDHDDCNCSTLIGEIADTDDTIMTHQEYFQYVETLKELLRDAEDSFRCPNVVPSLLNMIPTVPDYGDSYKNRVHSIEDVVDGFVAYEYFDEDEEQMQIVVRGTSSFPDFPGYELCYALLECSTLAETCESLGDNNPAKKLLEEILNV